MDTALSAPNCFLTARSRVLQNRKRENSVHTTNLKEHRVRALRTTVVTRSVRCKVRAKTRPSRGSQASSMCFSKYAKQVHTADLVENSLRLFPSGSETPKHQQASLSGGARGTNDEDVELIDCDN